MARKIKSVYKVNKTLLNKVKRLAKGGLRQNQIYISLGWSEETWYKKVREHPELAEAIAAGQTANIKELVSAANRSAKGFSYIETHTEKLKVKEKDQDAVELVTKVKEIKKMVQPVPASFMFLLTNIDPENFKNRSDQKHSGEVDLRVGDIKKKDVKKVNDLFDDLSDK